MRVFVSTADASGDLHAAALITALRERVPGLELFGLGGGALVEAGLEVVVPQSELAIGGLVEVLGSARRVLSAYARLRRALLQSRPDLVLLVDSPDLNLPLAGVARRKRLPVYYYIAPQVWAWRHGRVRKLAARTRRVGVIFPFEEPLLRRSGVAADFVGHPLVDRMAALTERLDPSETARGLGLDPDRPVLGLLPGSRTNELDANLPVYLETAQLLHARDPGLQVQLILAPTFTGRPPELPPFVRLVRGPGHQALAVSTCVLAAPGTVTLEAALLGVPLIVAHRTHPLSFELARRLARVSSSCMVNLISQEGLVPERIQAQARPTALAAELGRLLASTEARDEMRRRLAEAARRMGAPGASRRAAELALEVVARA